MSEAQAAVLTPPDPAAAPRPPTPAELAARVAGRLCHDLISPLSALISGIDLLDDPSAQDMREDALKLIGQSARKLAAQLSFARAAYGASAEVMDSGEMEQLAQGLYAHVRAELDWAVTPGLLPRPAGRILLCLAQLAGVAVLPIGGRARLTVQTGEGGCVVALDAQGPRARLGPEVQAGLLGQPLSGQLAGHWVQAYYLHALTAEAGGRLEAGASADGVAVSAILPG
jgi:histidine phosphotransferase ChpT